MSHRMSEEYGADGAEKNGGASRKGEDGRERETQPDAPTNRAERPAFGPDFDTQYRPLLREAFVTIVRDDLHSGADPAAQARAYAERGKPDFALAYLLVSEQSDDQKRAVYAQAHERRAAIIEQRARQFSQEFHRPFPLLFTEAAKDRALARQIRTGRGIKPGAGRHLPLI
jgi:hypothetical protein